MKKIIKKIIAVIIMIAFAFVLYTMVIDVIGLENFLYGTAFILFMLLFLWACDELF